MGVSNPGFAGTSPKAKVGGLLCQYAPEAAPVNERIAAIAKEKIGKSCTDFNPEATGGVILPES